MAPTPEKSTPETMRWALTVLPSSGLVNCTTGMPGTAQPMPPRTPAAAVVGVRVN